MKNAFHLNTNIPYNVYSRNPETVKYGKETISCLAPKIWVSVAEAIKSSKSLDAFKYKIRQWKPDCPCRYVRLTCYMLISFSFSLLIFSKSIIYNMYLFFLKKFLQSSLVVFVFLQLMYTPVGLIVMWINYLIAIWAVGLSLGSVQLYGSIGTKHITIYFEWYFLFTFLCLYIFITLCVFFAPWIQCMRVQ